MAVQPAEEAEDQGGRRWPRSHGPTAQQLLLPGDGDGEGEGEGDGEGRPQHRRRTESTRRRRKLKEKGKKKKKKIYVEMCVWDRFVD
jgi:hypothetical protein